MDIKILMIEDSAFMRKIIMDLIEGIDGLRIVGIARDGIYALEAIEEYNPDIITLDIEMPRMNGLKALKEIKRNYNIPVIMLSSISSKELTMEALEVGAEDFIEKPEDLSRNVDKFQMELEYKIKTVVENHNRNKAKKIERYKINECELDKNKEAVVIAASTGGPKVLNYMVSRFPKTNKPIFIVQHMPKAFTASFAERLDQKSVLNVVEAKDRMDIVGGKVYIAPGDYHMFIKDGKVSLDNKMPKISGVRPAADHLFESASQAYRDKLLGVVLTGMGRDGSKGVQEIKKRGGYNIAQNKKTSVIFGMAESAISTGSIDEVLSIEDISEKINNILR